MDLQYVVSFGLMFSDNCSTSSLCGSFEERTTLLTIMFTYQVMKVHVQAKGFFCQYLEVLGGHLVSFLQSSSLQFPISSQ